VYHFQAGAAAFDKKSDVRIGETDVSVELSFKKTPAQLTPMRPEQGPMPISEGVLIWRNGSERNPLTTAEFQIEKPVPIRVNDLPAKEPGNLILPVLAGRRVNYYREQVSRDNSVTVMPQDSNLVSRIMPLVGSSTPEGIKFAQLCRDVLRAELKVLPGENGQQFLGMQVDLQTSIPLESMGAGLSGALNLLIGLSQARGKLFIIEEPEDDLHPGALKKLLDAIAEASQYNQFLISTHSSIVLTRLGAVPDTVVVQVTSDGNLPPTSRFEVKDKPEDRMEILRDLGYSLADMALGEGWVIFEESTAERLVYQWLAPWFAPGLRKLRHVSARGNERAGALLTDFKEMFLFAHLEPLYRHRAWVILDGDKKSLEILAQLRSDFTGWPVGRFRHWEKGAIEHYYPSPFAKRYDDEVMAISDGRERQKAKQDLFKDVMAWIEEDPERAREEFGKCAEGMISVLKDVEEDLASYDK
jgi:predicted ATPase